MKTLGEEFVGVIQRSLPVERPLAARSTILRDWQIGAEPVALGQSVRLELPQHPAELFGVGLDPRENIRGDDAGAEF